MPLEVQMRVLDVLEQSLRQRVYEGPTPDWLTRPGRAECGPEWSRVRRIYRRLTDGLELPDNMPMRERRQVDGVIGGRGRQWRIVEVDESQHFNPFRALTLELTRQIPVAYPRRDWLEAARAGRMASGGGWAAPKPPLFPMAGGRHRQRAFRDALADVLPAVHGWAPTLRIADFEVEPWIWDRGASRRMRALIQERLGLDGERAVSDG
jgi:hypothetical protein